MEADVSRYATIHFIIMDSRYLIQINYILNGKMFQTRNLLGTWSNLRRRERKLTFCRPQRQWTARNCCRCRSKRDKTNHHKWVVKTFEGKYKNTVKHTYFLKYWNTFDCVSKCVTQKLYYAHTALLVIFTGWCRTRRIATPLLPKRILSCQCFAVEIAPRNILLSRKVQLL